MATISQLNVSLSLNPSRFVRSAAVATHAVAEIGHGAYEAVQGVRALGTAALETQGKLAGLVQQAKDVAFGFVGIATAAGGMGLSIKLAAEAEATETAMGTLLGSADLAQKTIKEIAEFKPSTNFGLTELENAARSLSTAGIAQDQIVPSLKAVGDVAAGVGIPIGHLATLYGRARTEGRIMAIELNQLANLGIPVIEEFAKQFGVAESEVRKLASEGKIGFAEFQRAMVSMSSEGGRFSGLMEALANSLPGLITNLRSGIETLFRTFGEAFVESSNLKDGLRSLTSAASAFRPIASALGTIAGTIARGFVWIAKVILPVLSYFKVFTTILFTVFKVMNVLALIAITRMVLGFVGISIKATIASASIMLVRGAYFAAARAAMIFHAISGPRGWLILIGSAVAAAGAVYGMRRALVSAHEEMEKLIDEALRIEETPALVARAREQYEELAAQIDTAAEAIERMKEAMDPVLEAFDDVQFEIHTIGMTDAQKELERMRERLRQVNNELRVTTDGGLTRVQEANLARLEAAQTQLDILKQQQAIREEMLATERKAAQEGMTAGQRMLDDLRRMGATREQIMAALPDALKLHQAELAAEDAKASEREKQELKRRADQIRQSIATPLENFQRQIADIKSLREAGALSGQHALRAIEKANLEFQRSIEQSAVKSIESPTALLAGTAEAELANDRLKTPFERMTDMQKEQLAVARQELAIARQQLREMERNRNPIVHIG